MIFTFTLVYFSVRTLAPDYAKDNRLFNLSTVFSSMVGGNTSLRQSRVEQEQSSQEPQGPGRYVERQEQIRCLPLDTRVLTAQTIDEIESIMLQALNQLTV